jgi:hypothetical protein
MKNLPTYAPYMEARLEDAKALDAVASAKKALHQCRKAATRVPKHARAGWAVTIKTAENRVAQAQRRAEAAAATLAHTWGFHQASMADSKARRNVAKAAHQKYKEAA